MKHANLDDPESVKAFVANKKCENSYKHDLIKAYSYYAEAYNLKWQKPKYRFSNKVPRVPTKETIEQIIASSSKRYGLIFRLLAETGAMPIELHRVAQKDINLEKGTISLKGCKGHLSRTIKLKDRTIALLRLYLTKNQENQPFPHPEWVGHVFRRYRNRLAEKLNDPTIKNIRLYDLRHYFGTMTYYKTKDILFTKQQMGHKKLETTLIYTHLVNFESDEFTVRVASSLDECTKLLEAGFEYVTDYEDKKIFKKRK